MATKKKHKKKNKVWHAIKTSIKVFTLIMLSTALILGILFYIKYGKDLLNMQEDAKTMVGNSTIESFRQTETSLVYDINDKLLATLKGTKDVYYISYEEIPEYAVDAMISIEDKKFLTHKGVDLKAIIRAGVALVRNKGDIKQGASTITQQLSRGIFLTNEVSWERKIKEMFIAIEIEKHYEKYEIMEFYLNNIYFANGYYGIEAASKGYFNKSVKDLSLAQITFLCAVPNNPTIYDPVDHKDNTIKRRDRILDHMLLDGNISKEKYDKATKEEIKLNIKTIKRNNYVETYVYHSAIKALMKRQGFVFKNYFDSEKEEEEYDALYSEYYNQCQQSLYKEGYRIYTSINPKLQKELQKAVDETLKDFKEKGENGVYLLQGAATSIDNNTGRVAAIVGGRSQNLDGYTLNRAYQSYRQPGSSIKPLIVYTPALQLGYYPEQIVVDEKFKGGPSNSGGAYDGKITLRKAVEKSKNVIAWKVFEDITPTVGLGFIKKMDFAKVDKNDYYLAASLGGFTYGTSSLEMASGFAAIENDGIYREPTCIVSITDSKGLELVNDHINLVPVYEENAARMMTSILTDVIKYGTGRGLGLNNMSSAGKTGTTNDKKDGWFVGYTPYYTTSVWVGYDLPKTLDNLWGSSYPGNIWKQYMNVIHEGLSNKEFKGFVSNKKPKEKVIEEVTIEEEIQSEEDVLEEETPIVDTPPTQIDDNAGEIDDANPDEIIDDGENTLPEEPIEEEPIDEAPEGEETEFEGEIPDDVGESY